MYSAVSGLQSHQTKMDVIGNNIANVNTYGYKANRATFSDVFYQTKRAASSPTATMGGTNPSQLGYGAKVSTIDVLYTRAGAATTSRPLDVYINGDGFIAVKTADGSARFTRAGVLVIDSAGNLVDRNGNMVLGIPLNATTGQPVLDNSGKANLQNLVPIKLDPTIEYTGIEIGINGEVTALKPGPPAFTPNPSMGGWMNGPAQIPANSLYQGNVQLKLTRGPDVTLVPGTYAAGTAPTPPPTDGKIHGLTIPTTADILGKVQLKVEYVSGQTPDEYTYTLTGTHKDGTVFTETGVAGGAGTGTGTVTFAGLPGVTLAVSTAAADANTALVIQAGVAEQPFTLGTVAASTMTVSGYANTKSGTPVDFTSLTWTSPTTTFTLGDLTFTVDPAAFGSMTDVELARHNASPVGIVAPGTSTPEKLGQLAIVTFANIDGLNQKGENYYTATLNSGEAEAYVPGTSGTGTLLAGSLEMSNVDLSREFTEMIITERGFQANTRMITVSDEMLQELLNMKR
jgi:flagellar hook protein FlgE